KRLAVSAARLSAMTGIPAETIRVADGFTDVLSLDHPLKPFDALVKVAFTHRAEPSTLREELTILRRQVRGSRPSRGFQFSMRYFNNGQGLGRAGNGAYFLGQGLLPEIAATLPLKHNDEFSAHQQLLLLKLDRLERELEEIERGIQLQIAEVHQQFQSAREEFRIARQRLAIAAEIRTVVLARYKAGLEGPASLDDAEYAERRADAEVIRVEYAGKLSLAQLLTVCGLRDDSLKRVETLFAARFSAPVVVFP
ncbi:MAG: TolC family protein, partial [Bryobacteraceae bacterium]